MVMALTVPQAGALCCNRAQNTENPLGALTSIRTLTQDKKR